jgi:hypothetical protein
MANLTGDDKEKYLGKLELALRILAIKTRGDSNLDANEYSAMSPQIEKLATTFRWLRVLEDEQDYHQNKGIYTELRALEGGMPNMLDMTTLNSDKNYADQHLSSIPETSKLVSLYGEALVERVLGQEEESGILAKVREEYRKRDFFETLKTADIMSTGASADNMKITKLPCNSGEGIERYQLAFAGHDKLVNAWCICSVELEEERVVRKRLMKRDEIVDHIYMEGGTWHISPYLGGELGAQFVMGAYHLMWQLNNIGGVMPKKVSVMRIGRNPEPAPGASQYEAPNGFYSSEVSDLSGRLKTLFSDYPDSFVLLSSTEHIGSKGRAEVGGIMKESFSKNDISKDEFIVIPTSLKQSQGDLIEVARMTPNAHVYEV